MLNRADIEYLKRVNAIRKRLGIAIDAEEFNQHSFLSAMAEVRSHNSKKKAS